MAHASDANVIYLQSHPRWVATQRRERQINEAMRRHPAFIGRQRAAASAAASSSYRLYSTADAPA